MLYLFSLTYYTLYMKRRDLEKRLKKIASRRGESLVIKEGGSHSKVFIGKQMITVPRHREISEMTARAIIKEAENG